MPDDPTRRFTDRVDDYVRTRPSYPPALLDWLRAAHGVTPAWTVADVGAGTGISAGMFLAAGHPVIAVEPNAAMRAAADAALGARPGYRSVPGRAEATGLEGGSVDLVSAAQAFHWFDPEAIHQEWRRILRPAGLVLVCWNARRTGGTPFLEGYEQVLRAHATDYGAVAERYRSSEQMRRWFGEGFLGQARLENHQALDRDGLRGRLLSSSYAPRPGQPGHAPMLAAIDRLFAETAVAGRVTVEYDVRAYVGRP
jgi:SAM-dependent methyltransferase